MVNGRPQMLNLKDLIRHFVNHRHDVIVRRTKFELAEAEKRAHILEGLLIALDHIEEVIKFMRSSEGASYATKWNKLMENQEIQHGANILKQEKETPKENENKSEDIFEKIDNMNLQSLKRSAKMRKFPEEEWSSIEDAGELRNYLKSKVSL